MAAQIKTKTNHLQNALVWPRVKVLLIDFTASIASTADSERPKGTRGFLPTRKANDDESDSDDLGQL